jgi:hypothetical protein
VVAIRAHRLAQRMRGLVDRVVVELGEHGSVPLWGRGLHYTGTSEARECDARRGCWR